MLPSALEKVPRHRRTRKRVGWSESGEGESVGHKSGKRIVEIKHKKKGRAFGRRLPAHGTKWSLCAPPHGAGRPKSDKEHSDWRYSL